METVLRVALAYFFILIGLRALGKRDFSQLSPFDLVTLLLIPEMVQQGMMGEDFSMTNAFIALSTLFVLVWVTSVVSHSSKTAEEIIQGRPTVLVSGGSFVPENMDKTRVSAEEIYGEMHKSGLARIEQVEWAILESDGKISFIPAETEDQQIKASKEQMM